MSTNFLSLPYELRIKILSNLDAISIIHCTTICKSVYDTLKNSSLYEYAVQRHLDGLEGDDADTGHPALSQDLVRRRRAWITTEAHIVCSFPVSLNSKWEIVGGVFAAYTDRDGKFMWLPNRKHDDKERTITHNWVGMSTSALAMDPAQDLLVLVTTTGIIHLRSLRHNKPHPMARHGALNLLHYLDLDPYDRLTVDGAPHIAGHALALVFVLSRKKPKRVLIWDWTSAQQLMDSAFSFDPEVNMRPYRFGFLDSTSFFIVSWSNFMFIRLYKLGGPHDSLFRNLHCLTLWFPPFMSHSEIVTVHCHAGPIEANPLPNNPFDVNDNDRLHFFIVEYKNATTEVEDDLNLFVHQGVFLRFISQIETSLTERPPDIQWDDWGPMNTAFCGCITSTFALERCVYGQRVVLNGRTGAALETDTCVTYDFSRAAVLTAKGVLPAPAKGEPPETFLGNLLRGHWIQSIEHPLFQNDVRTHLPCVRFSLEIDSRKYRTFMINGDCIIGLQIGNSNQPNANANIDVYRVYVQEKISM